jgi:hypothetical protein
VSPSAGSSIAPSIRPQSHKNTRRFTRVDGARALDPLSVFMKTARGAGRMPAATHIGTPFALVRRQREIRCNEEHAHSLIRCFRLIRVDLLLLMLP